MPHSGKIAGRARETDGTKQDTSARLHSAELHLPACEIAAQLKSRFTFSNMHARNKKMVKKFIACHWTI
jgi:hypothetical protein